jgi:hypothetical protein
MEDLALYGPMKRPDKQGIDTYQTDDYGKPLQHPTPFPLAPFPEPPLLLLQAT